jgi:DNA-binding transcriptional ArsR family regulator
MVSDRSPALDRLFRALAHPARRAMLRKLAEGERNLSELAAPLDMSFPAASKHVRALERAHLVRRRVVGRTHVCQIAAKPLKDVADWAEGFRKFWDEKFDALDAYLSEMKQKERTR